jgi:Flp pilus assembly protein TadG
MVLRPTPRPTTRGGATTVEFAVVLVAFMLLLFSVFEYGRYVMMENLLINATREGCRYALVHSQDPTVVADVQAEVRQRLGGLDGQFNDLNITVFPTNNPTGPLSSLDPDDPITVRVTATFRSIFPTMPYLPMTLAMRSSSIMTCEGN